MTAFKDIPIGELLPQQPPFRFVDALELYSEEVTRVSFTVGDHHLLLDGDHLAASGLVEHMAQASAARVGYVSKYILHIPVRIGYIGQVKKLVIHRLPRKGETLITDVMVRNEVFNITLADMEVRCGDELIATATLKSAIKDD